MRTYIPITVIEERSPVWAARIRERDRAKRRRLRQRPEYIARELAAERARYAANPKAYNARKQAWIEANREKRRQIKTNTWKKHRAVHMRGTSRLRAKKLGVAFDLTVEWFDEKLKAGHCELSGLPFDFDTKRGPDSPSVDRINPKGGYTQDNCRLILGSLNRALFIWGDDYFARIAKAVLANRGEL